MSTILITATARGLAKAAREAARMVNEDDTRKILTNLLLTADKGGAVSFSGSNLDGWTTASVAAEVAEPGATAVDARIAKLLAGLSGDDAIKLSGGEGAIIVARGRSRYRVDTLPAELFPPGLTVTGPEFALDDADRRRIFETPLTVIARNDPRFYLCGIGLKSANGRLVACGTDGMRLIETSAPCATEIPRVIVPPEACEFIARLDGCTIRVGEHAIEARTGTCWFVHRLIAGAYPAYERLITTLTGVAIELDRVALVGALRRMLCVAERKKGLRVAELVWRDGELSLALRRQPGIADDIMPGVTSGSGKTGVSIEAFIHLLDALPGKRIVVDAAAPPAPIRLVVPGDPNLTAIAMPCQ